MRQVRAAFDEDTITVYQAFNPAIAEAAVAAGAFVPPFSMERMTWIKPSFLWMMYRCGWAEKPGQERVLAVRMWRTGFETALRQACLSSFEPETYATYDDWRRSLAESRVRVQWDPERRPDGSALPYRSLQVGLSRDVVEAYVNDWVVGITDLTSTLRERRVGQRALPTEHPYPLPTDIRRRIGASRSASEGPDGAP